MGTRALFCLSLALIVSTVGAFAAGSDKAAALAAAKTWLSQIDKGSYAAAWQESASYLKGNVTEATFVQQLTGVRQPLGELVSRKVLNQKFTESVPGAPDGKYVIIRFQTSLSCKKSAVETITPMLDKDGRWRISGYFIK